MKKIIFTLIIACYFISGSQAQTQVVRVNALKSNDYGVRYVLPKTILNVEIEYTETIRKAGSYAKYASRYLGLKDAEIIIEDETNYTLDNVTVTSASIPNKEKSYLIAFKAKTTAPFVYLTEDGMLCSINAEYESPKIEPKAGISPTPTSDFNPQSIYTEEYLRSGSISKMAEVAAKNIYKIRESRQDILTGETDNVPKDGEAMKLILKNLDAQEKAWMELFTGTSATMKHHKQIVVEPTGEINHEILFRFSKYLGVVDTDDLSGQPVYWSLKDLKTVEIAPVDPKKQTKEALSLVYNVPGKANLSLFYENKNLFSATFDLTQFGTTEILETSLLENKKALVRIYFYPQLGAIKQIIQ
ncbi:DUF4831 domain-containing protein [Bacteroidia bacterium]|nr:DUF4831 domain-containing protein [Bacteroidia bacterium]GHU71278.1 DUF4831 domain-containing protein [Bacteroidia bacterium]